MTRAEEIFRAEMADFGSVERLLRETYNAMLETQNGVDEAFVQSEDAADLANKAANALLRIADTIPRDSKEHAEMLEDVKRLRVLGTLIGTANKEIKQVIQPVSRAMREVKRFKID